MGIESVGEQSHGGRKGDVVTDSRKLDSSSTSGVTEPASCAMCAGAITVHTVVATAGKTLDGDKTLGGGVVERSPCATNGGTIMQPACEVSSKGRGGVLLE